MKKDIFIIAIILIAVIAVSGCINSPIDNANDHMKNINNDITEGDTDYNAAIDSINSKDYENANINIQTAREKFSDAQNQLSEIEKIENDLNESVYGDYIDIVKEEVSLKSDACEQLYLAIQYYAGNDSSSGNSYSNDANSIMKQAVTLQNQRNQIVEENPDLFKKAGII